MAVHLKHDTIFIKIEINFYHNEQFKSANQSSSNALLETVQVGLRGKYMWWREVV
jgi:hypothetical protein